MSVVTFVQGGAFSVAAGITASFSAPWGGAGDPTGLYHSGYLIRLFPQSPVIPTVFTDAGNITVSDTTGSQIQLVGVWDDMGYDPLGTSSAAYSAGSLFHIAAGASVNVSAVGGPAVGYRSDLGYVSILNEGAIEVSGPSVLGLQPSYGVLMANSAGANFQFQPSTVTNTGTIEVSSSGGAGVFLGPLATLNNSGAISAHLGASGVTTSGFSAWNSVTINNSGSIIATASSSSSAEADGIEISSQVNTAYITNSGTIGGASHGIAVYGTSTTVELINTSTGSINGGITIPAVHSNAGSGSYLQNYGVISGGILLDDGNDIFDGRGGTLGGSITLNNGHNLVYLGNDGETVYGGNGDDTIHGGSGADNISGGAGNDWIDGGGGNDTLDGGGGVNTLSYLSASAGVTVNLGVSSPQTTMTGSSQTLSNFQILLGSTGADHLTGDGAATINGEGGDDVLDGGGGASTLSYASATHGIIVNLGIAGPQATGIGNQTLSNFQQILGSAFADHLTGAGNGSVVDGNGGDDVLDGGGGSSTVSYASATHGVTVSLGIAGAQNTGVGNQTLSHFQNILGSAYNDVLSGDAGNNLIDGGGGNNTVTYAAAGAAVTVDLQFGAANGSTIGTDTLRNIQTVIGSAYDDVFYGGPEATHLDGAGGTNTLDFDNSPTGVTIDLARGVAGDGTYTDTIANFHTVIGSRQDDVIRVGGGNHDIAGGTGANTFAFVAGAGTTRIADFSSIIGDKLDLSGIGSINSLADLQAHTVQVNFDSTIDLGGGQTIFLPDVAKSTLTAADVILHTDLNSVNGHANSLGGAGAADLLFRDGLGDWGYIDLNAPGGASWRDLGQFNPAMDVVGHGDFNGDGTGDVLFRNIASGAFGFVGVSASGESWRDLGGSNPAFAIVGTGDFNGDGMTDVLFRNNTTGSFGYVASNGNAVGSWHDLGLSNAAMAVVGTGDFNGDGVSDVLFRNNTTGELGYVGLDRGGHETWHGLGYTNTAMTVAGTGDFNGDGVSDILFRTPSSGAFGYIALTASGTEAWHDLGGSNTAFAVAGVGDYNGDGVADVLFRNSFDGELGYVAISGGSNAAWHGLPNSNPALWIV